MVHPVVETFLKLDFSFAPCPGVYRYNLLHRVPPDPSENLVIVDPFEVVGCPIPPLDPSGIIGGFRKPQALLWVNRPGLILLQRGIARAEPGARGDSDKPNRYQKSPLNC